MDGASRLVVVFVTYLLYEMMHTMFNIPYGTLLSAMAENPQERAMLSSARGIGGMLGTMMQWGLVGDAIDYNEYVTGKRTEGSIYGTFNMVRRLGQALGNSFCVAALGWIGYNAVTANAGLPQSEGTILGIKALCLLAPALFSLGSWIAFKFIWNIDSDVRKKIAAAKAERS